MRSKAIFMALLAFTFGAQAVPVSQSDAASVARAWMQRNVRHHGLGKMRPMRVRKAMTHRTSDGTEFHSFRMRGGGTVITSADTENAPVIAFTPKDLDLSAIDPKSPLWALLNRDLSQRGKGRQVQNGAAERHRGRWSELRRQGKAVQSMSAATIANEEEEGEGEGDFEPSDMRVPALVKSKWSQGGGIWNYFTPNCGNKKNFVPGAPTNIVCGCVATAMSQLMRYHEWPLSTTSVVRQCSWAGVLNDPNMRLETKAGEFDWANMPLPAEDVTDDTQRQAIGKLTSDAGISVYMMYNDIGADGQPGGESGAFSFDIPDALKSVWGYGSAIRFAAGDKIAATTPDSRAKAMKGVLFANFDAGLPVLMGVSGVGGHQIVADGYGYDEDKVDYVHLNMGWSGQCDMWYNLPDMEDAGFNVVNDVVYNVMMNGTDSTAIISGRVTDETGSPVENAAVTVLSGSKVVTNALTSATGVWGAPVQITGNQTDFSIRVDSPDGLRYGTIARSAVKRPQTTSVTANGVGYKPKTGEQITVRPATVQQVADVNKVGNSWGNDVVLMPPSAMIVTEDGAVTNVFYTLDDALAAAAASDDPVTVEVIAPIELRKDAAVGGACTIRSSASDPSNVVTVAKGAVLAVAADGVLTLENVVLTNALGTADAELVTVAADGTLELGADVVLYGRITTEAEDGLVLVGELKSPVFLDCKAAPDICQEFGSVRSGAEDEVRDSATNIVNWAEGTGEVIGLAEEDDTLRWGERPLTIEEAVGYYVTDDGATTNLSRRLDRLIARYAFADVEAPIVLLADDLLTRPLTLKHDLALFAAEGTNIAITVAPTACFTVPNGVSMSVEGVTFMGLAREPANECNGLFLVDGGDLTLGEGARLSGLIGTSSKLGKPNSGAVNVMSGTLTLTNGAEIAGCEVTSYYNRNDAGYGGGVYLNGTGCRLVLAGGRIIGCRAQTYGGGVYAYTGSEVFLSGETTVVGNFSGNDTVAERCADDIYFEGYDISQFTLEGPAVGTVGVRWGESDTSGNVAGQNFITVADGVDPTSSLPTFVSDVNPGLVAGEGEDALKWEDGPTNAKYLLTVIANDLMKLEGETDPELTYSAYGQKNPSAVLSGALAREAGEEAGTYAISQGTLDVSGTDYRLAFVGGTFTIVAAEPGPVPPGPTPEPVVTNCPCALAFKSIERRSDLEWALVVTNRRALCWYRLIYTDDLAKGFTTTGAWEQATADGPWPTNVVFGVDEVKPAYFWRAEGTWGTDEIPPVPPDLRTPAP